MTKDDSVSFIDVISDAIELAKDSNQVRDGSWLAARNYHAQVKNIKDCEQFVLAVFASGSKFELEDIVKHPEFAKLSPMLRALLNERRKQVAVIELILNTAKQFKKEE